MRINFCMLPTRLTGGPLAILEYANRFSEFGHEVTLTTYPMSYWPQDWIDSGKAYPWFPDLKARIVTVDDRLSADDKKESEDFIFGLGGATEEKNRANFSQFIDLIARSSYMIGYMPDCDINIATSWDTVYPVFFSRKGKPVYFMQHYEEVFDRLDFNRILNICSIRCTYELPMYKIANSSWLQRVIKEKYGQDIPFSNNALDCTVFQKKNKLSDIDGVFRVLSYCDNREWKGFADLAEAFAILYKQYGKKIEWHTFGQVHNLIQPDNQRAPYIPHLKLSYEELADLYASSDVVVCPSWYESFPLPPLEAMASGTAVITTPNGTEDYCKDGFNCLIIPSRSPKRIVEAVNTLLSNKELQRQLIDNGLDTVKRYSWEKAARNRERMLIDILNNETTYDRYHPLNSGFIDESGKAYSVLPTDLQEDYPDGTIIYQGERRFVIQNERKRLIVDEEAFHKLEEIAPLSKSIDEIECMRIPMGHTIWSISDI